MGHTGVDDYEDVQDSEFSASITELRCCPSDVLGGDKFQPDLVRYMHLIDGEPTSRLMCFVEDRDDPSLVFEDGHTMVPKKYQKESKRIQKMVDKLNEHN